MDMLGIIGKQSGKTVESVVKKKRNAAVKDTVVYFCTGVHLAWFQTSGCKRATKIPFRDCCCGRPALSRTTSTGIIRTGGATRDSMRSITRSSGSSTKWTSRTLPPDNQTTLAATRDASTFGRIKTISGTTQNAPISIASSVRTATLIRCTALMLALMSSSRLRL